LDNETASAIRRGQRLIRMVSELHRLGYQRLRIMPYFHPLAWRLAIGSADVFSPRNGAWFEDAHFDDCVTYSSASRTAYFQWEDAHTDNARQLADKFVVRFSALCERGRGRDWAYAGWMSELLGVMERENALPFVMEECFEPAPQQLTYLPLQRASGERTAFDLPPPPLVECALNRG
jgi:hypothetical protein